MNEITISEEARKAASEIFRRDNDIRRDTFTQEHFDSLAEVVQLAINSETAPLQKRIEELERLNEVLRQVNGSAKQRLESTERQLLAMREALKLTHDKMLNWFSSEYAAHPDTVRVSELLAATPSDLASKYVKREVLEKCVEVMACNVRKDGHNFGCSYERFGNCPDSDFCNCQKDLFHALTLARKELEK